MPEATPYDQLAPPFAAFEFGPEERASFNLDLAPPDLQDVTAVPFPKHAPYVFDREVVDDVIVGLHLGINTLLVGPTGCGKTSLPVQVAARVQTKGGPGWPIVRFNMDGETRVSQIRGQHHPVAVDGVLSLEFRLGPFADAMRRGYWVILDEIDAAVPAVLFTLQSVLEEGNRSLTIPETGERIEAHPSFRLFATSNTIGYRAHTRSHHAGTNVMNSALVDRFGMLLAVDYPDKRAELERIKLHVPALANDKAGLVMLAGICKVAEDLRNDTKFRSVFSTRRAIQWARLIEHYPIADNKEKADLPFDMLRAAELSVLRKIESPTDAKVAREVIRRTFKYPGASK